MSSAQVRDRFELLKHTSGRSMAALANIKPTWVIQTAPEHLEMVQDAFANECQDMLAAVPIHVVGRSRDGAIADKHFDGVELPSRFLSLRLDADDHYLRSPLVGALQRFENRPPGTLIDFPRGFLLELDSGRVRRKGYSVQGPFYGVITTPADPIAARGNHGRARAGRTCVEELSRAWVQTSHANNIFTQFEGRGWRRDLKSMAKQMRQARGSRPVAQILARPLDLVPVAPQTQKSLHRLLLAND